MEPLRPVAVDAGISPTVTVRVSAIERELARLWGDAERADGGYPALRPRTANLIIATADAADLVRAAEMAPRLAARHPGRAILVGPAPSDAPSSSRLQATAAVHCPLTPHGRGRLCSEVVTLVGAADALDETYSAVAGLLVPDLPVFLWWQRPLPTGERLFSALTRLADCLLVDARTFADVSLGLRWLAQTARRYAGDVAIADLEWGRLTPWREVLARAFRAPDTRAALDRITSVAVHYAARPAARSESPVPAGVVLLIGWLASRLGWHLAHEAHHNGPEGLPGWRRQYQRGGQEIVIQAAPDVASDLPAGEIVGIEILAPLDAAPLSVTVTREPDGVCVATTVRLGEHLVRRQVAPLTVPAVDELVAAALDAVATDPVYGDALRAATTS